MLNILEPEMLDSKIELHDFNANLQRLRNSLTRKNLPTKIHVPDGNTNSDGLALFAQAIIDNLKMADEVRQYDTIILKSCYSASAIKSNEQLEKFKHGLSETIMNLRRLSPNLHLVILTPPPRRRWLTSTDEIERVRTFCDWAVSTLPDENLAVIDLHNKLSSKNGTLAKKYCRSLPFDQHPNEKGSRLGLQLICDQLNMIRPKQPI